MLLQCKVALGAMSTEANAGLVAPVARRQLLAATCYRHLILADLLLGVTPGTHFHKCMQ